MKKTKNSVLAVSLVLAAVIFGTCANEADTEDILGGVTEKAKKAQPESRGVEVTPATVSLYASQTQAFSAKLSNYNSSLSEAPDSSVDAGGQTDAEEYTWSITKKVSSGTLVTEDGVVVLGANEAGQVVVKAVSVRDSSLWGTAVITVKSGAAPKPNAVYTVMFDINGGTSDKILPVQVTEGESVMSVLGDNWVDPVMDIDAGVDNYYFLEKWNTAADGSGDDWAVSDPVLSDLKVYAIWGLLEADRSAVTFNTMGETVREAPKTLQVLTGKTITLSSLVLPAPESDSNDFEGWFQNKIGLSVPFTADTIVTEKEMTVYAKWSAKTYQISFESNGGTYIEPYRVTRGSFLNLMIPQKDSSVFAGWHTDENFSTDAWGGLDTVNGDIKFYAKWNDVRVYKVTFDTQSGTPIPSEQNIIEGGKVHYPSDPRLTGYKFSHWSAGGEEWNFNEVVTNDMELKAQWLSNSEDSRVVTYDSNGGTAVTKRTVKAGTKLTTPPEPTKSGAVFGGWYKADNTAWDFENDVVNTDITLKARWNDVITYTVTFNSHGGNLDSSIQAVENTFINMPTPSPAKSGATFAGWYKESNYATAWDFVRDRVNENMELHAKWTHTVTFVTNGGNSIVAKSGLVTGQKITPFSNPLRTDATFEAWYKEASLTNEWVIATDTVTSDITLYAAWTHKVTFDANGGSPASQEKTVKSGGIVTAPSSNPTKSQASFDTWCTDLSLRSVWDPSDPIKTDTTLYARWIQANAVTFNSNGGSAVTSQSVLTGQLAQKPSDPTYGTAKFEGWYEDTALTKMWYFDTKITAPITLYAGWSYLVTFDSKVDSISVPSVRVLKDHIAPEPAAITVDGAIFASWWNGNSNYAWNFAKDKVTSDITLTAHWGAITHKVIFETLTGSKVDDQNIAHNGNVKKPSDPTMTGHTFAGWYNEEGLHTLFSFNAATGLSEEKITGPKTLYAKWNINKFKVNFVTNVTSLTVPSQDVEYDYYATQPTLENPGYGLTGWYTATDYKTKWNFSTDTVTKAMTLYAKWALAEYTVKFDTDNGTEVEDKTVKHGAKVEKPAIKPTKSGFDFDNWYKESSTAGVASSTKWDFANDTVTRDTTIYAKYVVKGYTVTFNANYKGASYTNVLSGVEHNALVDVPLETKRPARDGYEFSGWYKDSDCSELWQFNTDKVTSNTIIWAGWTVHKFTVTFNPGEGATVNPQSVNQDYGSEVALPRYPDVAKTGHAFKGWYPSATAAENTRYNTYFVPAGDVTLYAKWTANGYTVNFNAGSGVTVNPSYKTGTSGTEIDIPAVTKDGHVLEGWYLNAEHTGTRYMSSYTIGSSTVTLYAKWIIKSYTVTFNPGVGSLKSGVSGTYTAEYGKSVPLPTADDITVGGYMFVGWSEIAGGAEVVGGSTALTAYKVQGRNTTLHAIYTPVYTITYNLNSGTQNNSNHASYTVLSSTITLGDPTRSSYKFLGWFENSSFTGSRITQITAGSIGNKTFYAKWTQIYTITYNLDGGANNGSNPASYTSETDTITLAAATKTDWFFHGWYTENTFTNRLTQITKGSTGNKALYAKWLEFPEGWTYDPTNGTASKTFAYTGAPQSFDIIRTGKYKFEAWGASGSNTDGLANSGGYSSGNISNLPAGTTVYVYVGGKGSGKTGGWNGGGSGGAASGSYNAGNGGGGATDFRLTSELNTRILVAGGAGGDGGKGQISGDTHNGGAGGGPSGGAGAHNAYNSGADGGTQTGGNAFGVGGNGYNGKPGEVGSNEGGGGGGGGYYGGMTKEITTSQGQSIGGGGGSGFVNGFADTPGTNTTANKIPNAYKNYTFSDGSSTSGINSGNGYAKVTYYYN